MNWLLWDVWNNWSAGQIAVVLFLWGTVAGVFLVVGWAALDGLRAALRQWLGVK